MRTKLIKGVSDVLFRRHMQTAASGREPEPHNGITGGRTGVCDRQTGLHSMDKRGVSHLKIPLPPSLPLTLSLWAQTVCKVLVLLAWRGNRSGDPFKANEDI